MAKAKLPKRIAGFKVPKALRKSKMVTGLLGSDFGRRTLPSHVAGAGAAAVVLVRERDEVADATVKGAKKGLTGSDCSERPSKAGSMRLSRR